MQVDSNQKLQKFFKVLENTGLTLSIKAIEATSRDTTQPKQVIPVRVIYMIILFVPCKAEQFLQDSSEPNTLVFTRLADAEMFLFAAQKCLSTSLSKLKRQFASNVRELANRSRQKQFEVLKKLIQDSIDEDVQPELKDEIIDDLEDRGVSVETLVFSSIRRRVVKTIEQRHTASSAFSAIENAIASPFLRSSKDSGALLGDLEDEEAIEQEERTKAVEQLGFMLRAPIAVAASIPFVLGAGIWPFITKVHSCC
jgi:signal recognition particle GTPase